VGGGTEEEGEGEGVLCIIYRPAVGYTDHLPSATVYSLQSTCGVGELVISALYILHRPDSAVISGDLQLLKALPFIVRKASHSHILPPALSLSRGVSVVSCSELQLPYW
jgi:hypothetical protein